MALPFGAHVYMSTANPSPLSFGFGLGVPQHHMPPTDFGSFQQQQQQPQPFREVQPSSSNTPNRSSAKRRQEFDNDLEDDAAMDGRSPSPAATADRPVRRLGGKKMRMIAATKSAGSSTDGKSGQDDDDTVDVGSLLASLPPSSLLPLLTSLINEKPELKPVLLSLIPRPTLETAVQAVANGARKLKDAYPYSHSTTAAALSSSASSAGFGFGFGRQPSPSPSSGPNNAMRDSYIRTRLRQPVRDFTKLLLSYMAYFSATPIPAPSSHSSSAPSSSTLTPRTPSVPLHPTETFTFLHAVTLHLLRFPSLTLAEFNRPSENVVFPRLQTEWNAWVQKVDDDVNKWGGMYRDEVVKGWERGLDELVVVEEQQQAQSDGVPLLGVRAVRDHWVQQVGWLIGRRVGSMGMEM